MNRLGWPVAALFAVATFTMVYLFVIRGSTLPASDGREAILLSPGERDLVLGEMRAFLMAVQQITRAVADGDAEAVARAARAVGAGAQQGVPTTLVGKLPLAFKRLGFDTHSRFDEIALNAEQLDDSTEVPSELATLMQNCVACHAAYRIDLEPR